MATITIEIGRQNAKKVRSVSFLVCHNGTKKRIPTEIVLEDKEVSPAGKIRSAVKAHYIEGMRRQLQDKLFALSQDLLGREVDAAYIAERITRKGDETDFFKYADEWMKHTKTKDLRNYRVMLNALERHIGRRALSFQDITFTFLRGFEESLAGKPRAQSQYLGIIRHLFREAMRQYNTDYEQVIKNDPFMRYRVPKQIIRKGVRALTLEQLLAVYNYKDEANPWSRSQLARDCFILSFCLMGMNSVDMYECRTLKDGVIKYNRAKTKDRRDDEAYIEVRVHPFLTELLRKYKGVGRVFSFRTRYADSAAFNSNLNRGLKQVGEAVGIEKLDFYQARHTFATLSRNLMRFSKSDVDEALNHVGTMAVADIYIQKDFSIINDNNFRLIERVFGEYM